MSRTWHWHQYETSCKTITGLSTLIYDPIIAKLAQRLKDVEDLITLSIGSFGYMLISAMLDVIEMCNMYDYGLQKAWKIASNLSTRVDTRPTTWACGLAVCPLHRRGTAVCLSRVKDTASVHGRVPRPCEVCT
ncbi:Putative nickel-responsive regulator [Gossypium arboreum]|uniref:Putative nickel-responsive regulator n=1 Tax=Gossypium arboreum TaxID=29729 RepID=A0A0B0N7K9_GOSAR|nr:Putative nickel-responsive regulator [Gossypium arboreum]